SLSFWLPLTSYHGNKRTIFDDIIKLRLPDVEANWILILVGLSLEIPSFQKRECGMRLILAPKSARAFFTGKVIPCGVDGVGADGWGGSRMVVLDRGSDGERWFLEVWGLCFTLEGGEDLRELGLLKQILETSPGILNGFVVFLVESKDLVTNERRAFWGKEFGEVEESKPRFVFCSSVSLYVVHYAQEELKVLEEFTMVPVCSLGRTVGFWNPDGFKNERSYRLLGACAVFGSILTDDDASSSKRFLPAIAKDSFCY
ncbi:hypothetical protein Tco_1394133, partial [Tanacetum coccineum]